MTLGYLSPQSVAVFFNILTFNRVNLIFMGGNCRSPYFHNTLGNFLSRENVLMNSKVGVYICSKVISLYAYSEVLSSASRSVLSVGGVVKKGDLNEILTLFPFGSGSSSIGSVS